MSRHHSSSERGQSMVIIAVLLVVLVGMSALVLDGGLGYAKRRQAQNAADAAALAGADVLCSGAGSVAAYNTARQYLLDNGASEPAEGDIAITDGEGIEDNITVYSSVTHPTFFAGVFGNEDITAHGTASAGCFVPCNAIVLPIAWACHPPVGEDLDDHCVVEYATLDEDEPTLYLVMDGVKLHGDTILACQDPETGLPADGLVCDMDGDGVNEILYGGERSWLDLNGGGGGDLADWIDDGFEHPLVPHMWFAAEEGVMSNLFQAAAARVGDIVLLPVYDIFCKTDPRISGGVCEYHAGPDPDPVDIFPGDDLPAWEPDEFGSENPNQTFFHVISYSAFYITCVEAPSIDAECPGKQAAQTFINELYGTTVIKENTSTIEGFFVQDYAGSGACEGPYAGVYTVYLK